MLGNWSNPTGTLQVNGGTLNLDGNFSGLGTFNRPGGAGTVNLTGTFTNTGNVFTFDDTTGVFNFDTGQITGGTLRKAGSGDLVLTQDSTLSGVTLDMDFAVPAAETLRLSSGLTVTAGNALRLQGGASSANVLILGDMTLDGPGLSLIHI